MEVCGELCAPANLTQGKEPDILYVGGLGVPEQISTMWRGKNRCCCGERKTDCPVPLSNLVPILAELSRLPVGSVKVL